MTEYKVCLGFFGCDFFRMETKNTIGKDQSMFSLVQHVQYRNNPYMLWRMWWHIWYGIKTTDKVSDSRIFFVLFCFLRLIFSDWGSDDLQTPLSLSDSNIKT